MKKQYIFIKIILLLTPVLLFFLPFLFISLTTSTNFNPITYVALLIIVTIIIYIFLIIFSFFGLYKAIKNKNILSIFLNLLFIILPLLAAYKMLFF